MEDIDVEREISILVRDIDTHLRNLKDLRKPWTGPWGITSRQAYGLGLAMLLVSPSTPNPMRGVLGAMAAAFSAGNVVVIAVISGQESITSFMKHNSRRYLHPDALFIMEGQNPDLAGKNFDRTLTFGKAVLRLIVHSAVADALQRYTSLWTRSGIRLRD